MATRRRTSTPTPPSSGSPVIVLAVGVAAAVAAAWTMLLPWGLVLWAAVLVAAFVAPFPELTGRKDSAGRPTAADAAQEASLAQFGVWRELRTTVVAPGAHWLPGKRVRVAWLYAVAVAMLVAVWPVADEVTAKAPWIAWVGAVAGFATVVGVDGAWRRARHVADPCDGVAVADIRNGDRVAWAPIVGGTVAAALTSAATVTALSVWTVPPDGTSMVLPSWAAVAALGLGAGVGVAHAAVRGRALALWRDTIQARETWAARWAQSKEFAPTPPVMVSHRAVGPFQVDVFDVPVVKGDAGRFVLYQPKEIGALVGAGTTVVVLHVPNIDAKTGEDVPGTTHPTRVKVVTFADADHPDVTAPDTNPEVASVALECAVTRAIMTFNSAWIRPVWVGADRVSEEVMPPAPTALDLDDEPDEGTVVPTAEIAAELAPAVWAVRLAITSNSVDWKHLGRELLPYLSQILGTQIVVAFRPGVERLFVGPVDVAPLRADLVRPSAYAGEPPARYLQDLREEVDWNVRWGAVKGVGGNIPTPQFLVRSRAALADGVDVEYVPFLCRNGYPPDVLGLFSGNAESQMAAGLNAAPFVSIQAFPATPSRPDGDRHPQGVVVVHSRHAVPKSPAALAQPPGSRGVTHAAYWVLRAMFDAAFDAAKLPRPELMSAAALTKPTSARHVWEVKMRLYGTTLAAVRSVESKLAASLAVPWLRIAPTAETGTITVYCGDTTDAEYAREDQTGTLVASLDWEQAFSEAAIIGANGHAPRLVARQTLPRNEQVEVLDFELPSPVSVERLRANDAKLRAASGNVFLDIRQGPGGAQSARLTCCPVDPMPFPAGFDWEAIDASADSLDLPFATGVDGEPVAFDIKDSPHVLVAGTTGSGKSVVMQSFGLGAARHGWDVWVIDPSKGAADFRFLTPYAKALAVDVHTAAGAVKEIVAELDRRKSMNAEHGASGYQQLPDDVRPPHLLVLLDEFTSLTLPEAVAGKPSDSLEVEMERAGAIARNEARAQIATGVGRIVREARSAGITLVLGTQKLAAKDLDMLPGGNTLKVNLARILMGNTTYGDRQSALRSPDSAPALGDHIPPGRGLFESATSAPIIIQSWFDPGEQVALATYLETSREPLGESEHVNLDRYVPSPQAGLGALLAGDDDGGAEVVDLGVMDVDWEEFGLGATDPETRAAPEAEPASGPDDELLLVLGPGMTAPGTHGWVVTFDADTTMRARLTQVEGILDASPHAQALVWVDGGVEEVDDVFDIAWAELIAEVAHLRGVPKVVTATSVTDEVTDLLGAGAIAENALDVKKPRARSSPAKTTGRRRPPAVADLWKGGSHEF